MADTFGQAWRVVRAHCPLAPANLVQYWVQKAYNDVCDRRPWSFLRGESEIMTNDAKSGTVSVTRGDATVTSISGITFAASDVGRQFRVGSNTPIYSIMTYTSPSSVELDRVYGDTTDAAAAAKVLDAYVTMPTDFKRILACLDTHNNWQLRYWITEDELNTWDAQRSAAGTPWALCSRRLSTLTATDGRVQYELWPFALTARNYPLYYIKKTETLTDDSVLKGPMSTNMDVLVKLALAESAEWPGLEGRKNPYFNLALAASRRQLAEADLNRLEVLDEEIYMTWLEEVSWINRYPFAPIDARYMQSTDWSAAWGVGASWPR